MLSYLGTASFLLWNFRLFKLLFFYYFLECIIYILLFFLHFLNLSIFEALLACLGWTICSRGQQTLHEKKRQINWFELISKFDEAHFDHEIISAKLLGIAFFSQLQASNTNQTVFTFLWNTIRLEASDISLKSFLEIALENFENKFGHRLPNICRY